MPQLLLEILSEEIPARMQAKAEAEERNITLARGQLEALRQQRELALAQLADVAAQFGIDRLDAQPGIFIGDELCQILEAGWDKHPRVHCRSGKTTIRQDLALAQRVSCVIGPETGVLNSVAFLPVDKVVDRKSVV